MKLKKKKFVTIILVSLIVFLIANFFVSISVSADGVLVKDMVDYVENNNMKIKKANRLTTLISFIISFIQVGFTGYAIISLSVAAIRYFTVSSATGRVEGRRRLANAALRAVAFFSIGNIFKVIYVVFN